MPPFGSLVPLKRKIEDSDLSSRKRTSFGQQGTGTGPQHWMIQWRNPQSRKHKTWEGDGVLVTDATGKGTVFDSENKVIGGGKLDFPLHEGKNMNIGGKEIELDCQISRNEYMSGTCFGRAPSTTAQPAVVSTSRQPKFVPPKMSGPAAASSTVVTSKPTLLKTGSTSNIPQLDKRVVQPPSKHHWTANWRKQQTRKHKTWDGDGYVSWINGQLRMATEDGKLMGTTNWKEGELYSGLRIFIGGKEIELDASVPASQVPSLKGSKDSLSQPEELDPPSEPSKPVASIAATSFYSVVKAKPKPKGPLHDPDAPGAVVMKPPTPGHIQRYNKNNFPVVPVVVDPILAKRMRGHQVDGVSFMYECVMGLRRHEGNGCILADEMGLGKTMQTIALIWTMLRQNPYSGAGPIAKKVLIVCPVSLITNWKSEFHKWLGKDRLGITVVNTEKVNIDQFFYNKTQQVLIIGYERLRTVIDKVSTSVPPIDLIICDEGHRLKSANNKTTQMFQGFRTRRRIILSGTPIQNDLSEFHSMAEFCNPGLLDDYQNFRKVFEIPILKSRAPEATPKEIELGEARTEQLLQVANSFVIRREASLLKKHLPPKHEYVLFVTPTKLQLSMFSSILRPEQIDNLTQGSTAESLALINTLTKISNSPILLKATADRMKATSGDRGASMERSGIRDALSMLPKSSEIFDMTLSGKLTVLEKMLKDIRHNTDEKCVLVSHYTSTLNILEAFCQKKGYSFYRLDGQTPQQKRQEYVNAFNKSTQRGGFIFLLSSKAGGVGINLIGGSRLFLIDSDWNPSHDLQAMARCHRDGQKRHVFIYRLVTAGTIDEKIFQRQITKLGLSASLIGSDGNASKSDSFSKKDLRDIFRINPNTSCNTHDLLDCTCNSSTGRSTVVAPVPRLEDSKQRTAELKGFQSASSVLPEDLDSDYMEKKKAGLASLSEWKHIDCLHATAADLVFDDVIQGVLPEASSKYTSYANTEGESRAERLLRATDISNIQEMDKTLTVADVPGGTISFIFEKSTEDDVPNDEAEDEGVVE
ncbi:RAD54B protein [Coprinopsis marcescibilis]|uniref:RAD54B protein n=1 Tax=Coprinopsis marcescibilis TaxID=230819 RepID=A0A5C3KZ64_COPMA|nr:RAD54B protein [Coprinopsis marcescibilis]